MDTWQIVFSNRAGAICSSFITGTSKLNAYNAWYCNNMRNGNKALHVKDI